MADEKLKYLKYSAEDIDSLLQKVEDGDVDVSIAVVPIYGGHQVTINDQIFDVMDGEIGPPGSDATVTTANITKALGYTPAKQDDITQLSEEIANYLPKNQGSANVGKILVVGTDGNLTLAEMPEGSSGDVIGTLDESNNILLTGNLANGTYTLKYENTDGTYTKIGNLTVGKAGITNLADPTSADWIINGRAGSDGTNRTDAPGHRLTNFIPVSNRAIVRVKNFDITNTYASAVYDANKATINSDAVGNLANEDCITELNLSGEIERFTIDNENIAFVRLCGVPTGADEDIIITVNEEII